MARWLLLLGLFCVCVTPALAKSDATTVTLRAPAVREGTTVVHHTGTVWVKIARQTLYHTKRARVRIARVPHADRFAGSDTALSDIYRYSVRGTGRLKLNKPLRLGMTYGVSDKTTTKVLKYWDSAGQRWRRLKTIDDDPGQLTTSGSLRRKHGIIGVFPKPASDATVVQGLASWYDWTGAACNDFPLGSIIRVTNVATGATVDSTVVSTGPFIPGRVVDLPREQFAAIANISAGVVEVTVQQIQ